MQAGLKLCASSVLRNDGFYFEQAWNKRNEVRMNKNKKAPIVGIDVSKDWFDAHWDGNHAKYVNSLAGFRKLLDDVPKGSEIVFESTGNYHYKLAFYLASRDRSVKVLNPYRYKQWVKSFGRKAKNDKIDSRDLAKYAATENIKAQEEWKPLHPNLARARVVLAHLALLTKISGQAFNARESHKPVLSRNDSLLDVMAGVTHYCSDQKASLKKELRRLVASVFPNELRLLDSIPFLGRTTAPALLAYSKGFDKFETHGRLSSYLGLVNKVEQSGTSVHVNGKIVKVGRPYMRSLLYMCAMGAGTRPQNKPCKDLHDRLIAKGSKEDHARVAVMHKLVKIAFGVVKNGQPWRPPVMAAT
jgi:transposase